MNKSETICDNIEIQKHTEISEVELKGEISKDATLRYRKKALSKIGESATISGFRKGHVPEPVLIRAVGEKAILEETAELVLSDLYPTLVEEHKLAVIGKPKISITKLAPGNPIGFIIRTAVLPNITLPDYKTIAMEIVRSQKPSNTEVTDKDIEETILHIRKQFATTSNSAIKNANGINKDNETQLPEVTDEFVKKIGSFKNVSDFRKKLVENMEREKKNRTKEKVRMGIGSAIIEKSHIPLPKILVEGELDKMLAQFKDDIKKIRITFDDYLAKIKKTPEDLRKEWKTDAEKRAKLQLILNAIAKKESLAASQEAVEREVNHLLLHFKDADRKRVAIYAETILMNEQVFQFLEKQS